MLLRQHGWRGRRSPTKRRGSRSGGTPVRTTPACRGLPRDRSAAPRRAVLGWLVLWETSDPCPPAIGARSAGAAARCLVAPLRLLALVVQASILCSYSSNECALTVMMPRQLAATLARGRHQPLHTLDFLVRVRNAKRRGGRPKFDRLVTAALVLRAGCRAYRPAARPPPSPPPSLRRRPRPPWRREARQWLPPPPAPTHGVTRTP